MKVKIIIPIYNDWQSVFKLFEEINNLKIDKNFEILVMCGSGNRSQRAAELLNKKGFKCLNVSDGFRGDGVEKIGWKNNQLPTK